MPSYLPGSNAPDSERPFASYASIAHVALLKSTAADELMLTTMVFDPADRLRSFELVADLARTPSAEELGIPS